VIQADRDVDYGLQKQAAWPLLMGPDFLKHFVAGEELALVEEPNTLVQCVHALGRKRA
jgi:hypothetical protein